MFDRNIHHEAAAECGQLASADVVIGANIYPNVFVGWHQIDARFMDTDGVGGAQQTQYTCRFRTDELPLFNGGTRLTIDGNLYECTRIPRMIGTGWYSEADMKFINRVCPKRAIKLNDGTFVVPNPPPANEYDMLNRVAHVSLDAFRLVRNVDGVRVDYADNTIEAHAPALLGFTIGAALANAAVLVQNEGPLENPAWNWITNREIWLGEDGFATQAVIVAPSKVVQRVAFAESPTKIFIEIEPPIYLG